MCDITFLFWFINVTDSDRRLNIKIKNLKKIIKKELKCILYNILYNNCCQLVIAYCKTGQFGKVLTLAEESVGRCD